MVLFKITCFFPLCFIFSESHLRTLTSSGKQTRSSSLLLNYVLAWSWPWEADIVGEILPLVWMPLAYQSCTCLHPDALQLVQFGWFRRNLYFSKEILNQAGFGATGDNTQIWWLTCSFWSTCVLTVPRKCTVFFIFPSVLFFKTKLKVFSCRFNCKT